MEHVAEVVVNHPSDLATREESIFVLCCLSFNQKFAVGTLASNFPHHVQTESALVCCFGEENTFLSPASSKRFRSASSLMYGSFCVSHLKSPGKPSTYQPCNTL